MRPLGTYGPGPRPEKLHMGPLGPMGLQRLLKQPQSLVRQPQSLARRPQSLAQQPPCLAQQQLWRQQELWHQQA